MSEITDTRLLEITNSIDSAIDALIDWEVTIVPECFCEERITLAKSRINMHGTIHYIATVLEELNRCRKLL